MTLGIILVLAMGIGFLSFILVKNVLAPRRAKAAAGLINQNKIRQAVKAGRLAVEKDPKNAEAHYNLAKAYLADNRSDQAYREFISVSRLGVEGKNIPEEEFRQTIAKLYVQNKEPEEALKEYILLIKRNPENPEYHFQAGLLFNERRRLDLAEQYLKRAVSLNSKNLDYLFELGLVFYQEKKLQDASNCLDRVLKAEPANPRAGYYMGKVLKDGKNYSGAIGYLVNSAKDQEYKVRSLVEIGGSYMSLNQPDKALPELERAVNAIQKEDDPDALYARYFLGLCYEKKQEFGKALAQWDKVYARKKNFRDVGEKLIQYQHHREET